MPNGRTMRRDPAFLVGNGPSRKKLNIEALKGLGTVYGCNAIYRDLAPHFLCAVDKKMIYEIIQSKYHENNYCYFKELSSTPVEIQDHPNVKLVRERMSQPPNSGVLALWAAINAKQHEIYLIGFDLSNPNNKNFVENVYAGTDNYSNTGKRGPKVHKGVVNQIGAWTIRNSPYAKFFRVVDETCSVPTHEGWKEPHMFNIGFETLAKIYGDKIWAK